MEDNIQVQTIIPELLRKIACACRAGQAGWQGEYAARKGGTPVFVVPIRGVPCRVHARHSARHVIAGQEPGGHLQQLPAIRQSMHHISGA